LNIDKVASDDEALQTPRGEGATKPEEPFESESSEEESSREPPEEHPREEVLTKEQPLEVMVP
jgi:hypothetical protein